MRTAQTVFFLIRSPQKSDGASIARYILSFPGAQELWVTEGPYSFLARFSAPEGAIGLLKNAIGRHRDISELECVRAPAVFPAREKK